MQKVTAPQIDLSRIPNVVCSNCGFMYWEQALTLKKISHLISQSGNPELNANQVIICKNCGCDFERSEQMLMEKATMGEQKSNLHTFPNINTKIGGTDQG